MVVVDYALGFGGIIVYHDRSRRLKTDRSVVVADYSLGFGGIYVMIVVVDLKLVVVVG